ncbi:MAG TPA: hypothetical protein VLL05_18625 [Terriglobales bacterium]|nr:hypothetical protein [Terriglobales bacterium]
MSKTNFVQYGDNGFWAYDVALGVFLKYLIDVAETSPNAGSAWLSKAVSWWRVVASVWGYGLSLRKIRTATQRQLFIAFAEEACVRLTMRESIPGAEMLGWNVLDGDGIHPRGAKEVQTAPVIELGRAVIALMAGECPSHHRARPGVMASRRVAPQLRCVVTGATDDEGR